LTSHELTGTTTDAALAESKPQLVELFLAGNRLDRVPTDALRGMRQLASLDLSQNRIAGIGKMVAYIYFFYFNAGNSIYLFF
jgi:Leucine-rich repeat (LRR) protein